MATFENTDVHFSLLPLLDTLPELGDEWHVEDRRKWLESLDATLAALYPIPGAAQETTPDCPKCGFLLQSIAHFEHCGHGHVVERHDGMRTRCGGPSMCNVCAAEQVAINQP